MAADQLTETFAALADPTRRAILGRLAEGEASVSDLAAPFPITVQAVSQHLKVLEGAGLITRGRTAQLRPSRRYPRLCQKRHNAYTRRAALSAWPSEIANSSAPRSLANS